MFSFEFCEIFKKIFFKNISGQMLLVLVSDYRAQNKNKEITGKHNAVVFNAEAEC